MGKSSCSLQSLNSALDYNLEVILVISVGKIRHSPRLVKVILCFRASVMKAIPQLKEMGMIQWLCLWFGPQDVYGEAESRDALRCVQILVQTHLSYSARKLFSTPQLFVHGQLRAGECQLPGGIAQMGSDQDINTHEVIPGGVVMLQDL